MAFSKREKNNVVIISSNADKWSFYIFNSQEIEDYLEDISKDEKVTKIAISLKGCDFIDSKGLSILIHTSLKLKDRGGNLFLIDIPEYLKETLWHARSSGLTQWVELSDEDDLDMV
jgi:anti-anti-sigma factor